MKSFPSRLREAMRLIGEDDAPLHYFYSALGDAGLHFDTVAPIVERVFGSNDENFLPGEDANTRIIALGFLIAMNNAGDL